MERAVAAAPAGLPAVGMFHAPVVGQHVAVAPARRAQLLPGVEVAGVAAHVDHAVDGGGAADHLAARRRKPPPAEVGFGLGHEAPVVAGHVHGVGEGSRHLNERAGVGPAVLQHQHAVALVFGEPRGEHTAGGPRSHDYIVELVVEAGGHRSAVIEITRPPPLDCEHRAEGPDGATAPRANARSVARPRARSARSRGASARRLRDIK